MYIIEHTLPGHVLRFMAGGSVPAKICGRIGIHREKP